MMHLLHALLPALFLTSTLAQLTAEATSATPDVTFPSACSFVFCSAQDCTGTCEAVNSDSEPKDDGEAAPNDMPFESIYYYNPEGNCGWLLYTCATWACGDAVGIGSNTCYNLYDDGVATAFTEYYYLTPA